VTPRRLVDGTEIFEKHAATPFSVEDADNRYPLINLQGVITPLGNNFDTCGIYFKLEYLLKYISPLLTLYLFLFSTSILILDLPVFSFMLPSSSFYFAIFLCRFSLFFTFIFVSNFHDKSAFILISIIPTTNSSFCAV